MKDRLIKEFKEHGIKYIEGEDILQINKYIFCFMNGLSKALDSMRFYEESFMFDDFEITEDKYNKDLVYIYLKSKSIGIGTYINKQINVIQ